MCGSCWDDHGKPVIWNEDIAVVVELLKQLYEREPTGGPLHVEVDDWNISGEVIKPLYGTEDRIASSGLLIPGYPDRYSAETHEICDKLAALFTTMPVGWRASALAHHEGWVIEGIPQR